MSQKNNEQFVLKKVPLLELVNALIDIYNQGFDFVDVIGILDEKQDQIGLAYSEAYKSGELDAEEQPQTNIKLSDEDLNQLT
jgi:hypothetical protein